MDSGNLALVMLYVLIGMLIIIVGGVWRLWTRQELTQQQWDKIAKGVEVGVALSLVAIASALTFYYDFTK